MKIRFLLACFLACLLLLGYAALAAARDDCPDCPSCYEPTGQPPNCGCIFDCSLGANCCDANECEECIDGSCETIDVNSVTVDVNSVCVGCNVTFTVCHNRSLRP